MPGAFGHDERGMGIRARARMKVLVCGGRDFHDYPFARAVLDALHAARGIERIVHGGASGADTLADRWGRSRSIIRWVYPADWDKHGRAAGMIRNRVMLATAPDLVVAFAGGRGTGNMVGLARDAKIPTLLPCELCIVPDASCLHSPCLHDFTRTA